MDAYDQFFARYAPEVQAISRQLRALVRAALPKANEVLVDRHNHIAYDQNASSASRIVYICPMQGYVRLGFMDGAQLPDPRHLLTGEGKRLRHIKVRSLKEAGQPAIRALLKAAWTAARTHTQQRTRQVG